MTLIEINNYIKGKPEDLNSLQLTVSKTWDGSINAYDMRETKVLKILQDIPYAQLRQEKPLNRWQESFTVNNLKEF